MINKDCVLEHAQEAAEVRAEGLPLKVYRYARSFIKSLRTHIKSTKHRKSL